MTAPRIAFNITSARVQHYGDVVDYLTRDAIRACEQTGFTPSKSEIDFYKKEVTRYAIIRHDLDTASKLKIKKREIL